MTTAKITLDVIAIIVVLGWFVVRFRKPKTTPNHARLIAKPGATLDLVSHDGVVRAKVILDMIEHDSTRGTTVWFVDYFKKMERVRFR